MTSHTNLNLVLDLDNTLIHSFVPILPSQSETYFDIFKEEKNFLMMIKQASFLGFVFLRPFLSEFLLKAQMIFNLYIYSAGSNDYVRTIINAICSKFPSVCIAGFWSRESMSNNLKCIETHMNVHKTYIIDDMPWYWKQKCFRIKSFVSFEEKISVDTDTNNKTYKLTKLFEDNDNYLDDYLLQILKIVDLEINLN
jgi:TFIIF-interacting CTD phosphatase-like protein